jgi:hypothetical protein
VQCLHICVFDWPLVVSGHGFDGASVVVQCTAHSQERYISRKFWEIVKSMRPVVRIKGKQSVEQIGFL